MLKPMIKKAVVGVPVVTLSATLALTMAGCGGNGAQSGSGSGSDAVASQVEERASGSASEAPVSEIVAQVVSSFLRTASFRLKAGSLLTGSMRSTSSASSGVWAQALLTSSCAPLRLSRCRKPRPGRVPRSKALLTKSRSTVLRGFVIPHLTAPSTCSPRHHLARP